MNERNYYDEQFLVRLTIEQKEALVRAAGAANQPLAVYIRGAIEQRINNETRDARP